VRGKNPLRVVLDTLLRTPPSSKLARSSKSVPTLFVHGPRAAASRRARLESQGAQLLEVKLDASRRHLDLMAALEALYEHGVRKLLVEGGSQLHGALLAAGVVERVAVFVAPRILADSKAKPLAAGPAKSSIGQALTLADVRYRKVGPDLLVVGTLPVRKQPPAHERWTSRAR
jgi:diaminohydroxyphosphoribosylaminopyrimidine deaminase/5-amino-6-(5-phosphoribosylamino)uracil reductase